MVGFGQRRLAPAPAYYLFQGGWSLACALHFTLLILFQIQVAHLSPLQLVLAGTVMEAACFLFEVPTGIVADLHSRRLSVAIGLAIAGFAVLAQAVWPTVAAVLVLSAVWGLGWTFVSGAGEAWITDEVGEDAVQPIFTRSQQLGLVMTVVGVIGAGGLGMLDLRLPLVVSGVLTVGLAIACLTLMNEDGFTALPRNQREGWTHLRHLFVAGASAARRPGVVRSFMVVALLVGLSSEVFDRLWTRHVVDSFTLPTLGGFTSDAVWFAAFSLVGTVLALVTSLAANRWAEDRLHSVNPAGVLSLLVLLQVAGVVGFALSGTLWLALAAMWVRDAARAVAEPVQRTWLNRNVDSTTRATTLSFTAQADAIGQVVGGPPLGALAGRTSIPVALLVSAGIFAPAAWVYARLRPGR